MTTTASPSISVRISHVPRFRRFVLNVLAVALILFAAVGLRWNAFAAMEVYIDEANTWRVVMNAGAEDYVNWTHHREHPPLSYMLVRASTWALGTDATWALRLPSFALGLLCVPAMYGIGRLAAGHTTGLLAALLATVDPNMVQQSGYARMYTLAMLTILLLVLVMAPTLRADRLRPWAWLGIGALIALSLWTSSLGFIVLVAAALAAIGYTGVRALHARRMAVAGPAVSGLGLALVLAGACAHVGLARRLAQGPRDYGGVNPLSFQIEQMHLALGEMTGVGAGWPIVLALAALGLVALWWRKPEFVWLVGVLAIVNAVGVALLLATFHHAGARHLTAMQPAVWLGMACLPLFVSDALGAARASARRWPGMQGPQSAPARRGRGAWHDSAVGCAVLLAGILGVRSLDPHEFERYSEWFLLSAHVQAIGDASSAGGALVYLPDFARHVGNYHGVSPDRAAQRWVEAAARDEVSGEAAPKTLTVLAVVRSENDVSRLRSVLDAWSATLEKPEPPTAAITAHLEPGRLVIITASDAGVEVNSLEP